MYTKKKPMKAQNKKVTIKRNESSKHTRKKMPMLYACYLYYFALGKGGSGEILKSMLPVEISKLPCL